MRKLFLLSILIVFLTGCSSINKADINTLINEAVNSKVITTNVNRYGYRYYLPKGLSIKTSNDFNEIITDHKYIMYLYVDVVSYNNKTDFSYTINNSAYYSNNINYNGTKGFIEVNKYKNDKYLIEIMYNYAKIEVIVYERDVKDFITYAITILASITYNDNVIESYLSNNVLDSVEENFDIFEIVGSDNFLQFATEEEKKDERVDPDYIN